MTETIPKDGVERLMIRFLWFIINTRVNGTEVFVLVVYPFASIPVDTPRVSFHSLNPIFLSSDTRP